MVIPKVLAQNSGFDPQESSVKLQEEYESSSQPVGLNLTSGEAMIPADEGIWDNYRVKRQLLHSWYYNIYILLFNYLLFFLAQLLLVIYY